jgi:hypothetical protein
MSKRKLTSLEIQAIAQKLRDFGYPVGEQEVREKAEAILATGKTDDIIGQYVYDFLQQAGLIGETDAGA